MGYIISRKIYIIHTFRIFNVKAFPKFFLNLKKTLGKHSLTLCAFYEIYNQEYTDQENESGKDCD